MMTAAITPMVMKRFRFMVGFGSVLSDDGDLRHGADFKHAEAWIGEPYFQHVGPGLVHLYRRDQGFVVVVCGGRGDPEAPLVPDRCLVDGNGAVPLRLPRSFRNF